MTDRPPEGWAFPGSSWKAHYFRGITSLCGKWGFYTDPLDPDNRVASPDDCAACRRALDKERAAASEEVRDA